MASKARLDEAKKWASLIDAHAQEVAQAKLDQARAERRVESAEVRLHEAVNALRLLAETPDVPTVSPSQKPGEGESK